MFVNDSFKIWYYCGYLYIFVIFYFWDWIWLEIKLGDDVGLNLRVVNFIFVCFDLVFVGGVWGF